MRRSLLALLAALALVAAACGEEIDDVAEDEPEEATEPDEPEEPEEPDEPDEPDEPEEPEENGDPTVAIESTELGDALVDADGMTLYLFDVDEQGESQCYDQCEDNWPPLIDEDPVAGEGVDEALLGTSERDDGSVQVTYNDWPLYYWQGDAAPGDATGQGVEDVWWLVDPAGEAIRDGDGDDGDDEDEGDGGAAPGY